MCVVYAQPLRGADVRQLNERIVLNLFYDYDQVSQSEIVTHTGLKPSTVLRIFSNLEERGEIIMIEPTSDGTQRNRVGRRPVYYRVNPEAHYAIGLTFAKDALQIIILDFSLNAVYSGEDTFTMPTDPDLLAEKIAVFVEHSLLDAGIAPERVLGLGIACPGNVDPDRGMLLSMASAPTIKNYPLVERLSTRLHTKIFLQGANLLAAQYYHRYEDADEYDRILYISIGSEVTASFYAKAPDGMLGGVPSLPVGRLLLQQPDAIFNMSDTRCINDLCSESSILAFARKAAGVANMEALDEALVSKNAALEQLAQGIGDALSYWISNLSMLFQPKAVILASRSKRFSTLLIKDVHKVLNANYYWPFEPAPLMRGMAHNFRKISRSAVDLVFDWKFGASLGWKRPKLLSHPRQAAAWDDHLNR